MEHEELCRKIIEGTHEAVIFADRSGIIRLWNVGAQEMFGYSAEEAIGQTLDIIIPEKLRARHWDGYHDVMETGRTRYGRELLAVPALRKDGTRLSLEFVVVLLRDNANAVVGTAALLRDVTTRWQQEKAVQERLATLEAAVAKANTNT